MQPRSNGFRGSWAFFLMFVAATVLPIPMPASAITAELAKKCRALAIKAHPSALPGTKTGTAQAERESFRVCISNNGTLPDSDRPKGPAASPK